MPYVRSARRTHARPFQATRTEVGTLAKLARVLRRARRGAVARTRCAAPRAKRTRSLKQQLLTQSLDEKIRLGHDLHDGIIQSLYAAGLTLESGARVGEDRSGRSRSPA